MSVGDVTIDLYIQTSIEQLSSSQNGDAIVWIVTMRVMTVRIMTMRIVTMWGMRMMWVM